jgi:hypothetical protein
MFAAVGIASLLNPAAAAACRLLAAAGLDAVGLTAMGRSSARMATATQRAYRFDIDDPSKRDVISSIDRPNAFNPGPPLYDPERQILVHYDTVNRWVNFLPII